MCKGVCRQRFENDNHPTKSETNALVNKKTSVEKRANIQQSGRKMAMKKFEQWCTHKKHTHTFACVKAISQRVSQNSATRASSFTSLQHTYVRLQRDDDLCHQTYTTICFFNGVKPLSSSSSSPTPMMMVGRLAVKSISRPCIGP